MRKYGGTKTLTTGAKMQVAFDFISLKLGNGRTLTSGRSGEKASGDIPGAVFDSFIKMVSARTENGPKLDDKMATWAQDVLPTLWPEWNVAPIEPTLGLSITKDFGPGRAAYRGVHTGEVTKLATRKGGRHTVKFPFGLMAMTSGEIANSNG